MKRNFFIEMVFAYAIYIFTFMPYNHSKFLWIEKCQLAKTQVVWKNITVQKYLNGSYFVQLYFRHIFNLLMCSYIPWKLNHSMTIYIKGHWSKFSIPLNVISYSVPRPELFIQFQDTFCYTNCQFVYSQQTQ